MQSTLKLISYLALALTIIPAILFLTDILELSDVKLAMIAGMVLWFVSAPFSQKRQNAELIHEQTRDNL